MNIRGNIGLAAVGIAVVAAAVHCSSSSSSSSSAGSGPTQCGPGPYVKGVGTIYEFSATPPNKTKEGAVVTFTELCPEKSFTSGADGTLTVDFTKGKPTRFKVEDPSDVPTFFGEFQADADFVGTALIVPKLFQGVIAPDWKQDSQALVAFGVTFPQGVFDGGVPDGGPTDPCERGEGVTFSVDGHPEAKVTYFTADAVPKPDPNGTATSTNPVAITLDLADGTAFTASATKAGCKLTAKQGVFTGNFKAEKGYALEIQFQMTH